jgi:hypothetical protein
MRISHLLLSVMMAGAFVAWPVASLEAQTLTPVPQRPAAGARDDAAAGNQTLDVSLLALGAYDDDLFAGDSGTLTQPGAPQGGTYEDLSVDVMYSHRFQRGEFAVSEASALRYYNAGTDLTSTQHAFTVGGGLHFHRTQLTVSESVQYLPFFTYSNSPQLFETAVGAPPTSIVDLATVPRETRFWMSSVALTQQIGSRASLTGTVDLRQNKYPDEQSSQTTEGAGLRFAYKLSRDLSFVLGYTYQSGSYVQSQLPTAVVHLNNMDTGVDYNHAIGRTRRTTIGFTTGTAMVQDLYGTTQRQLTGSARLNREIGRTWHATAMYRRSFSLIDGFQQPVFADALALDLGGTLQRRISLSLTGSYSQGQMGFNVSASPVDNYTGSARARFALSRLVSLSTEVAFYNYRFGEGVIMPIGVPRDLDRRTAKIGFELWLPVIR